MKLGDLFKRFWYCPVGECVPAKPCTKECGYRYEATLSPEQYEMMKDRELS